MEPIQGEYSYSREFARRAMGRFFWRYSRRTLILIVLIAGIGAFRILIGCRDLFTLLCLMFPFLYLTSWYSFRPRAEKVAIALRDPRMTLVVDDTGMIVRNLDHTGSFSWAGMKEVWQFPELWLLFPYGVGASFTAIPTTALSEQDRTLVLSKLRENGTRIVG